MLLVGQRTRTLPIMLVERLARTLPRLGLTLTLPGLWLTLPTLWLAALLFVQRLEYLRHGHVAVLLVIQATRGHGDEPGLRALVVVEQTHVDNVVTRGVSALGVELPQLCIGSQVQVENVPRLMADGEPQVGIRECVDKLVAVHGGHAVSRSGLDAVGPVRHDSVFGHKHQPGHGRVVRVTNDCTDSFGQSLRSGQFGLSCDHQHRTPQKIEPVIKRYNRRCGGTITCQR